MESRRILRPVLIILFFWLPVVSASSVMYGLDYSSDDSNNNLVNVNDDADAAVGARCPRPWQELTSVCWTPVPLSPGLPEPLQAELYCQRLDARPLFLLGLHVCVRDALELGADDAMYDLMDPDLPVKQKRIMGNNGF